MTTTDVMAQVFTTKATNSASTCHKVVAELAVCEIRTRSPSLCGSTFGSCPELQLQLNPVWVPESLCEIKTLCVY